MKRNQTEVLNSRHYMYAQDATEILTNIGKQFNITCCLCDKCTYPSVYTCFCYNARIHQYVYYVISVRIHQYIRVFATNVRIHQYVYYVTSVRIHQYIRVLLQCTYPSVYTCVLLQCTYPSVCLLCDKCTYPSVYTGFCYNARIHQYIRVFVTMHVSISMYIM